MPIFIHREKSIIVYRPNETSDGGPRRSRLGMIFKNGLEFRAHPDASPTEDELLDVESFIQACRAAAETQRRARALGFPQTIREVTEYYLANASDTEKNHIMTALLEAIRTLRKDQRGAGVGKSQPEAI